MPKEELKIGDRVKLTSAYMRSGDKTIKDKFSGVLRVTGVRDGIVGLSNGKHGGLICSARYVFKV